MGVEEEVSDHIVQCALARATGANIHEIKTVIAYYRNVTEMLRLKDDGQHARRRIEQGTYLQFLSYFADTGMFPGRRPSSV